MSRNTSFPSFAGAALRLAACLLLAAGLLLAASPAYAQSAAPAAAPRALGQIKIAVINTEQILLESQAGKKALADLKKVQEQKQSEIDKQQKEIHDLQAKIDDGRLSLAQDKLADLEKQIEDRVTGVRRMQEDASRELNKKKDDILGSVDQRVMPVINQIGKEMGYTLIFRKFESGLIYADEAVDITPTVIKRLDANQGK
jgi:outer membrane protein